MRLFQRSLSVSNHIIMSNDNGASTLAKSSAPVFENLDVSGWRGRVVEDSGIFMFMFDIAPDAEEFPIHTDSAEWLALVISGSGTLYAGTADLQKSDAMNYAAGDFISFQGSTPHGWKNDNAPSRILFVKRS
jgi:quercetin dioxygenase-like cupin family protein